MSQGIKKMILVDSDNVINLSHCLGFMEVSNEKKLTDAEMDYTTLLFPAMGTIESEQCLDQSMYCLMT